MDIHYWIVGQQNLPSSAVGTASTTAFSSVCWDFSPTFLSWESASFSGWLVMDSGWLVMEKIDCIDIEIK